MTFWQRWKVRGISRRLRGKMILIVVSYPNTTIVEDQGLFEQCALTPDGEVAVVARTAPGETFAVPWSKLRKSEAPDTWELVTARPSPSNTVSDELARLSYRSPRSA